MATSSIQASLPVNAPAAGIPQRQVYLARLAWVVLGWNVLVAVWGALVRSTGSGAGCGNHWPLCNGQVIPVSPTFHTIIEFTHRMMTGASAFLVIGLLVLTLRWIPKPHPARRAVTIAAILLLVEALLGALLVKLGYVTGNRSNGRVVMLAIHFTNTLLLLGSMTVSAWLLSGRRIGRITSLGWLTVAATIAVGVSGSLAALGDTLFPTTSLRAAFAQDISASSPMILRLRGVHPLCVAVAAVLVLILVAKSRGGSQAAAQLGRAVVALLVLQIVAGVVDLALLAPWWMQLLHLLLADMYWIAVVLCVSASTDNQSMESGAPASVPITAG
jgi:cytochrome c oxidase assembly protein subunit 15